MDNARRISLRLVIDTLQRDVLVGTVFSATLFRNFSSHVNVRRDIFVLVLFEMFEFKYFC